VGVGVVLGDVEETWFDEEAEVGENPCPSLQATRARIPARLRIFPQK